MIKLNLIEIIVTISEKAIVSPGAIAIPGIHGKLVTWKKLYRPYATQSLIRVNLYGLDGLDETG